MLLSDDIYASIRNKKHQIAGRPSFMTKIRAFLDTSVVVRVLFEHKPPDIFADDVLAKVTYVVGPIVLQELLLACERRSLESPLQALEKFVEIVPVGPEGLSADDAARTVRTLEPNMTIPVGYGTAGTEDSDLKAFLTAVGIHAEIPVQRFSVQSRASETQRVILLDCRGA